MKTLVLVVAALLLVAGSAGDARAAGSSKLHKHHAQRYDRPAPPARGARQRYPGDHGWQPHDASKLPFGSTSWWDQMLREGRINGDTM
jgi:hypothetical protein